MHAGFPQIPSGLMRTFNLGMQDDDELKGLLSQSGGHLLAEGMAMAVRLGFSLILREGLLDEAHSHRAREFFADNFEITDPMVAGGKRYYQGRFLIRTRQAGDNMNVLVEFCPEPDKLYCTMPWGQALLPFEVVRSRTMDEAEAEQMERHVDLVIRFRDARTILGLIGQPDVDIVGLLLKNLVQLTGNVGHLFKLGAIGSEVQRLVGGLR
ncbi:MAG: hypothetical protein PHH47_11915 [Gallionella sp.]|nr:hypothetical protein [Gallionella sp.]MDD4946437.1 hypothetical protein [Gallionella sp.]